MYVIKPRLVVTMDDQERIIKDGYIGIENGKIVYVGKEKPKEAEEIKELPNKMAIPGFINSHTHVAMTVLRGLKDDVDLVVWLNEYIFPAEAKLKAEDVYYGSLYGMAEMISSGITTLNDMYYFEEKIADAALKAGIRAMLSRGVLDLVSEERSVESELKVTKDFLNYLEKMWSSKPEAKERIFFAYGPHAPYTCSKELLQTIKEESERTGYRIHMHIAETKWEREEIKKRTGLTPVKYLDSIGFLDNSVIGIHVVWVDDEEIKILAKRGVNVVHNPISNMKLASGFSPVQDMLNSGVNVALGTDGPASNNRLDMFREMHVAALIHKGRRLDPKALSAKDVFKMATINGARALGLDDKIGSIEVGKSADIIMIDLERTLQAHPHHDVYSMIVYALDTSAVTDVIVDGKWVYRNKEFTTLEVDKIAQKIEDIRARIIEP